MIKGGYQIIEIHNDFDNDTVINVNGIHNKVMCDKPILLKNFTKGSTKYTLFADKRVSGDNVYLSFMLTPKTIATLTINRYDNCVFSIME